jgi:hypothetical protein
VIAGGGIGDGAIDGVVNLYVIDDLARTPIANAEVRVGTLAGTTDATGLFIAEGVVGPQDVVAKASGHRAELWAGVNGANVTLNLAAANVATPDNANLSGAITNFTSLVVTGANHVKVGLVGYSQVDNLGDAVNNIATAGNMNLCFATVVSDPCNFTITTRTGKVALLATIFDLDTKGTQTGDDDTAVLIGWAFRQGITVSGGANQTGQDLALISSANQAPLTVDFGSPPSNLTTRGALIGIELGDEGVFQLGSFVTPAAPTMSVPKLSVFSGATAFRLSGIANDGLATNGAQSVVLRRGLAGPTLAAGTWLAPPTGVSLTRTGGTWSNASGATVHGIELTQGGTSVLSMTTFDSTRTQLTIPDLVSLPSGAITAKVQAIGADGLDVTNFSLDADRDKLVRVSSQDATIN